MSPVTHTQQGSPTERTTCHAADFATRRLPPSLAVITAHGELDAANAAQFVEYVLESAAEARQLLLDLTGIEFFGTAGFSALDRLNARRADEGVEWALVPSSAITRLLKICDPDSALPICDGVDAALAELRGEPRPLLELVSKPG